MFSIYQSAEKNGILFCALVISATQRPDVVSSNLQKEGRVAGPYPVLSLANFQCHPVGIIPTKQSYVWRTIYDLSYPQGNSINEHIAKDPLLPELCSGGRCHSYPPVPGKVGLYGED